MEGENFRQIPTNCAIRPRKISNKRPTISIYHFKVTNYVRPLNTLLHAPSRFVDDGKEGKKRRTKARKTHTTKIKESNKRLLVLSFAFN